MLQVFTENAKMGHFLGVMIFRNLDNEMITQMLCVASGGSVNTLKMR
jgi:hypothetical protein